MEFAELPAVFIQSLFDLQGKVFLPAVRGMYRKRNAVRLPAEDFHTPDRGKFFECGTGTVSIDSQKRYQQ